ncbi:hypothetical protein L0337_38640 [candidate division KSB1 bacterium]|nr:hypothetical protein [candidate division KSB1 bacterium]
MSASNRAEEKKQTATINFPAILCIAGGLFTLWLCFVLAQLGGPAASAVQPTGALAASKRLTLLPLTQLDLVLTSFRQQLVTFFLGITVQFLIFAVVIRRLADHRTQIEISQTTYNRPLVWAIFAFFSYLPFAGGNLISGLAVYAAKWRFNDSVFALFYEPIHALLPEGLVKMLMIPADWEITNEVLTTRRVDLALLITKLLMAGMFLSFVVIQWRNYWQAIKALPSAPCPQPSALCPPPFVLAWPALALNVLGVFFLLSPTVQPWYLLWILPLLCLARQPGWITWSATIFLAYWILDGYARTGLWQESAWVKWVEYGMAGLAAIAARAWKRRT